MTAAAPLPARPANVGSKHRFLLVLIAIATGFLVWIVVPIAAAIFAGAVAAIVLEPAHAAVTRWLRGRNVVASGIVTLLALVLIGGPIATVAALALREFADGAVTIARDYDERGVDGVLDQMPRSLRPVARRAAAWLAWQTSATEQANGNGANAVAPSPPAPAPRSTADAGANEVKPPDEIVREAVARSRGDPELAAASRIDEENRQALDKLATDAASSAAAFAAWLTSKVLGLLLDCAIAIIALFCLLAWGPPLVQWVREMIPMPLPQSDRLLADLRDTTRGVVFATFATAVVQTVVASGGYLMAGVPTLPLVAAFTFVAGMIPVVGAATITCLIGVLQILRDEMGWGLFLVGWGLIVVNLTENIMTPWLCSGRMRMPAALLLFVMIGGIAVFGALGLVAGPLIVAFFRTVIEIARGHRRTAGLDTLGV